MLRPEKLSPLNLARRPFVNQRPVRRVAAALWVAASLVVAIDAVILVRHLTSSSAGRGKLAGLEAQVAQEVESLRRHERALREFDLEDQNRHVEFLNRKIAQRTFPWSRLFEQIGEVLPPGVRLLSLRPIVAEDEDDGSRRSARPSTPRRQAAGDEPDRWVELAISGEAETDEAILDLVDALFRHPAFSGPNLRNEAQERSLYRFNLAVRYLPDLEEDLDVAATPRSSGSVAGPAVAQTQAGATGGGP